jgi:hypothetical protein
MQYFNFKRQASDYVQFFLVLFFGVAAVAINEGICLVIIGRPLVR